MIDEELSTLQRPGLKTGLVSITFRHLCTDDIIEIVSEAGLDGIEWGGDVHVPHGDNAIARRTGECTRRAGLKVSSYGSYYRLNHTTELTFETVLKTAQALQTDLVRVWAGHKISADADTKYWDGVVEDALRCAQEAQNAGIKLALEWHDYTLTDTAASATKLFKLAGHENLFTYWQPRRNGDPGTNAEDMDAALGRLIGLHVCSFDQETGQIIPLSDAEDAWAMYLDKAEKSPVNRDIYAMIEHVRDDAVEQFFKDALVLKKLVNVKKGCAFSLQSRDP